MENFQQGNLARKAIHRCTFGISEHECLWVKKFWTKFVALAQLGRGHVGACGQWSSSRLPRYVFARRDTLAAWGTLCQASPHFQTSENRLQAGHGGQMSKHVNERCASWSDRCSAPPSWLKWARAIISLPPNTSSSHSSEPSQTWAEKIPHKIQALAIDVRKMFYDPMKN